MVRYFVLRKRPSSKRAAGAPCARPSCSVLSALLRSGFEVSLCSTGSVLQWNRPGRVLLMINIQDKAKPDQPLWNHTKIFWGRLPTVILESGAKGRPGSAVRVIAFGRLPGLPRVPRMAVPRGRAHKNWRSALPKRPFRVGGVTKVGDPAPQNGYSAWEGSQNLYIGNLPIVRLWRLLPRNKAHPLKTKDFAKGVVLNDWDT